ncbi:DUF6817 domain-containing protein [Duganella violaceipulchra]|uniref:2OG-Fe(II) oxygenase n=1 Tax=Duganella violaceipulchra TaxID=2849652 RepID=A0AA41HAI1_9BURK|nr:2OG-Fe(II) oxygenase [Duganella violaceicalia]MBV6320616.1 2OG-Fe(II) oxygenase [Duganella violaceicalia]MCP2008675.1 Rps23 Pro-64 3,4-dihydroxylase Tpa1-like proline 4-hydroxylase [Duganella violaceicalia]
MLKLKYSFQPVTLRESKGYNRHLFAGDGVRQGHLIYAAKMTHIQQASHEKIKVLDGIVPQELYQELINVSHSIEWKYWWTTDSNTAMRYWHHEVGHGGKENAEDVSDRVERHPIAAFHLYQTWLATHIVPHGARVLRFYLNAHTYGTDGWPHVDSSRPNELTTVLYLNEEWYPEWGGETVIFNKAGDIAAASMPRRNRLLTFPSHWLHAPRPLHKAFGGLRVVLVVKFALPTEAWDDIARNAGIAELVRFLDNSGSGAVTHSGRSLLTHLVGTCRILQSRNADEDVCRAGLFHSIYGAPITHCTLALDRIAVREQIGERAERLAWLFCVLDRPRCWSESGPLLPLAQGGSIEVSAREIADLRLIEQANLDERGTHRRRTPEIAV